MSVLGGYLSKSSHEFEAVVADKCFFGSFSDNAEY
jgi:hypothetical protein